MNIEVAYVGEDFSVCMSVDLPCGARVADAIEATGLLPRIGRPDGDLAFAVYGRTVAASHPLAEGDRVEITLPLVCDPSTPRRALAKRAQAR